MPSYKLLNGKTKILRIRPVDQAQKYLYDDEIAGRAKRQSGVFTVATNSDEEQVLLDSGAVLIGKIPVLAGAIILAKPTVDGGSESSAQTISSQVVSGSMTGQKLLFSTVVRDDFGIANARILTNPGEIHVPDGVRYGRFTLSVQFPGEGAGIANGIRWARILSGAGTHRGNSGSRPAVADSANTMQAVGAIMPVVSGDYYWGSAIQNSGGDLTLGVGSEANNWASNWLMAEFFF